MYRFLPGIVRKNANNSASNSTTTTENKGIDLGLSGTKQKKGERVDSSNVEPGYSVQKQKRANSDSECSLKVRNIFSVIESNAASDSKI